MAVAANESEKQSIEMAAAASAEKLAKAGESQRSNGILKASLESG